MNHYRIVLNLKIREFFNPYLGPIRRKLAGLTGRKSLNIISNNCWGGMFIGISIYHIRRQLLDYISLQKIT